MNDALSKFIEHLSKSSPELWAQMLGYHRSLATSQVVLDVIKITICVFISCFIVPRLFKKSQEQAEKKHDTPGYRSDLPSGEGAFFLAVLSLAAATTFSLITGYEMPTHIADALHPQRAAAIDMIEQMKEVPK